MATTTAPTTTTGIEAAHAIYQGDWDERGTTTASFPSDIAKALLEARGWTSESKPYRSRMAREVITTTKWTSPNGEIFWDMGEALQLALAAEVAR